MPDKTSDLSPPSQWAYWNFFWPLALVGFVGMLAGQFQNATLARYPDATRDLANFAVAASIFAINQAVLIFIPQMATVYHRSIRGGKICLRFMLMLCGVLTLPMVFLGFTRPGMEALAMLFDLDATSRQDVALYLQIVTPVVLLSGLRMFWTGLLIQCRRSLSVTGLNLIYLVVTATVLATGLANHWNPMVTAGTAQTAASAAHALFCFFVVRKVYRLPAIAAHEDLTYREAFRFFWPLALNSTMFALSRPVIFAFVSRTPEPENQLAALRVSFELAMIFFNPINQFRNLFVTFGTRDSRGVKRFMIRVMTVIFLLMLAVSLTPLGSWLFTSVLAVPPEILPLATQSMLVLCLVPLAMTFRNYFHGISLAHRTTGRMGLGGVIRVVFIFLLCWGLEVNGLLNPSTASLALVSGFLIEAITVLFFSYRKAEP